MAYQPVTEKAKCIVDGCENMTIGEKCTAHRSATAKVVKTCATPGCAGRVRSKEFCTECTRKQTRNPLNPCSNPGCIRKCHGDMCAICVNKLACDERKAKKQAIIDAQREAAEQLEIDELIEALESYGFKVDKVHKIISAYRKHT